MISSNCVSHDQDGCYVAGDKEGSAWLISELQMMWSVTLDMTHVRLIDL